MAINYLVNQRTIESDDIVSVKEGELIKLIEVFDLIEIRSSDYNILTKNILKKLQEKKAKLIVCGDGYTITLEGKDIINFENELLTNINIHYESRKIEVVLNEGRSLPGKLFVHISNMSEKYYTTCYKTVKFEVNLIMMIIMDLIILGIIVAYIRVMI